MEEVEALEDVVVDEEDEEGELKSSEGEVEERPPRKPRIKLGDIMGVTSLHFFCGIRFTLELRPKKIVPFSDLCV